MAFLSFNEVTFTFSDPPVLDAITMNVERGERIGLLGRNGMGKSTLLRLLCGELAPDDGTITFEPGAKIAYLTQQVPKGAGGAIFDRVAEGVADIGSHLAGFRRLDHKSQHTSLSPDERATLEDFAARIGAEDGGWDALHRVERTLREMELPPDVPFASLSAGMKRRVLLARAFVNEPDALLLDEPTNHLDIDSILWLQNVLLRFPGTSIVVTHDRAFLQALATRIIEIERGRLFDWSCDYATFLKRRDAMLEAEVEQQAQFDRKLAEEERWIRQGIEARRTRNEGRVRALVKMREERRARREKLGQTQLQLQEVERSGNLVVRAKDVSFSYGDRAILRDFSATVFRGDRIGLIGPNGVGKTTLLKILLGKLQPNTGSVRIGTHLSVAYFDQLREQLDETQSARDNVADGAEFVLINGRKRHVLGYLQDFLFTPERAQTRVGFLSGGERNRLHLAKLFTKPANVLVLDEPTNDLDTETLELLEEVLVDYAGTLLLVSHDRAFLNNVVTSTLVFEGDGIVREYAGGYDDWLRQRQQRSAEAPAAVKPKSEPVRRPKSTERKLSYKEQRELESLPGQIDSLETRIAEYHEILADPAFYQRDGKEIARTKAELGSLEQELAVAFTRWEELESLRS